MKTSIEQISNLERKLAVEVPVEVIQETYKKVFEEIRKDANIKGFRKGKAPIATIKSMYKDKVEEDVVRDIIQKGFFNAIQEHSLDPISQPDFQFDKLNEDKSFSFTASFEVRPEVKLTKYEGLEIVKEKLVTDDSKVDETIENIRKSRSANTPLLEDRPLREGDIAVINFEGTVDGELLEGGSAEGHELEIGSNSFIEGFEEGLMGMKIGDERTLDLSFPENYHVEHLKAKPVSFKTKLTAIHTKTLPELSDDFAKTIDPKFETMDQLKEEIKKDLEANEQRRIDEDLKNRLLKKLVEENPVDVPPSMLKDQKKSLIQDFERRMTQQGMSKDQYEEYKTKWDADFESTAAQMIQSSFLINELASDKNLGSTPAEIEEKMNEFAANAHVDIERVREFYGQGEHLNRLQFQITEEKVVKFLLENAKVEEKDAKDIPDLQEEEEA
jgi:trigger factor